MLYFARYNLFGASQIPKREGTISYAHGTHATRLKGIRMIVVAPERRSLPRSTHPQSRRRQVARVEVGSRRRKKRDTQNLLPPPLSFSVPIDTKSETKSSVVRWIGRFSNIKRIHNGFLVAETVPDSDGRHRVGSWHLNFHWCFRDWPFTLRLSVRHRRVQAWLGPFVTSARWNWIMDDPPITRLSGSKRFEHRASDTDPEGSSFHHVAVHVFSPFSVAISFPFPFLFFIFFASFSSHNPTRPGPGSKERKVGRQLANDYVVTRILGSRYQGQTSARLGRLRVEVGDIRKYTNCIG